MQLLGKRAHLECISRYTCQYMYEVQHVLESPVNIITLYIAC